MLLEIKFKDVELLRNWKKFAEKVNGTDKPSKPMPKLETKKETKHVTNT